MKIGKTLRNIAAAAGIAAATLTGLEAKALPEKITLHGTPAHIQYTIDHKTETRLAVTGANIAIGCLKSGIGAYANDKSFLEGCWKGAIGGAIAAAGENIATYNYQHPGTGAAGKLTHSLGISIEDNVMRGEGMLSQYQIDAGPMNLTFRGSIIPRVTFTLMPAIGLANNIALGNEFDPKLSLYNLTPIFKIKAPVTTMRNQVGITAGYTTGNVITYWDNPSTNSEVISHEFNHAGILWNNLNFTGEFLNPIPTEKIHPNLEMEKIQRWWNIGQDLSSMVLTLAKQVHPSLYYLTPQEIEAYWMERP